MKLVSLDMEKLKDLLYFLKYYFTHYFDLWLLLFIFWTIIFSIISLSEKDKNIPTQNTQQHVIINGVEYTPKQTQ